MKKNKKSLANKFIVEGLNLARFLNVLLEKDIKLYNIKRPEYNIIEFECSIKDSYVVQQYANKINLKVQKQNKGILKFFSFLKNRLGILVGGIVAIVLFLISNQFTMNFYVLGLENIEKSRVEAVLNNHGIEKYKINNFDCVELENILSSEIPEISMVSVVKKGTAIVINIKEKLPEIEDSYKPIVAEYNLLIEEMEVYSGFSNFKVGDTVKKGETIIFPYSFDGNNQPIACEPKAKIVGKTWFCHSEIVLDKEEKLVRSGNYIIFESSYNVFGKNILEKNEVIKFENYEIEENNLNISYLFLPIKVDKKVAYELKKEEIVHDFEKEKEDIIKNCLELAYSKVPSNILIEDEKVVLSNEEDKNIVSIYLQANIVLGED